MNNLDRLFDLAANENIFIHFVAEIPCYKADALFVAKDSCRMILILEKLKNNVSRLTEVLAEELGHYFTSTGVNFCPTNYFEKVIIDKCENKALKWACDFLIPDDELKKSVLKNFYNDSFDLISEDLNVSKDMLIQKFYFLSLKSDFLRVDKNKYLILSNFPSIYTFEEK